MVFKAPAANVPQPGEDPECILILPSCPLNGPKNRSVQGTDLWVQSGYVVTESYLRFQISRISFSLRSRISSIFRINSAVSP